MAKKRQSIAAQVKLHWVHEPKVFSSLIVERGQFRFESLHGDRFYGWVPSKIDCPDDLEVGQLYLTCSDDGWSVYRTVDVRKDLKFTPWLMDEAEKLWLQAVYAVALTWAQCAEMYGPYPTSLGSKAAGLAR